MSIRRGPPCYREAVRVSLGWVFAAGFFIATSGCKRDEETERRCKAIDGSGGTVTSHDFTLNIAIRPEALTESTEVCIAPAERPPNGPPFVYGAAYRVTPDVELGLNATVTYRGGLPMDTSGVAVGVILREDFEAGSGKWLALPVTRLEPENDLVAGSDPRLSMFYGLCQAGDCEGEVPDPTVADTTQTDSTTDPTTDTTTDPTTDPSTDDASATMIIDETTTGTTDPTTDPTDTTTGDDSTSSSSSGGGYDCDALPAPPFTVTSLGVVFPNPLGDSEDLAMTGNGTFVAASDQTLLESDEDGNTSEWYDPINPQILFGLRFNADGDLLAANTGTENIDILDGASQNIYVTTGWVAINGIYPDHQGAVWASDFGGNAIYRVNPNLSIDTINAAAPTANGVFFDENRSILYWSQYNLGQLHAIPIDEMDGSAGASSMVADLTGTTDGLTMDVCGHIYAVDQNGGGACRIDRVHLDEAGDLSGDGVVEVAGVADLPGGCSNAQFGFGFGDEHDEMLFTVGVNGDVYRVDVQVPGYPIPF